MLNSMLKPVFAYAYAIPERSESILVTMQVKK